MQGPGGEQCPGSGGPPVPGAAHRSSSVCHGSLALGCVPFQSWEAEAEPQRWCSDTYRSS